MDSKSFFNYCLDDDLSKFNEFQLLSQSSFLWTLFAVASCILLIIIAFTPIIFGILVIIFLLLTIGKALGISLFTTDSTNLMSSFSRDAFVCYIFRKQTNERFLRGTKNTSDLGQILLQTTMGKSMTTSTDLERIMMIFPPDRSSRNAQRLCCRSNDASHCSIGELNRTEQRMSYLDLTMRKYQDSSYDFYKKEKPIVFKFIPNRSQWT